MAIAGRVAIVPKGDWSAETEYKRLDEVTYNNTMFIAKKAVPKGTLPTNAEYWSKSIVGGVGAIATKEDAGIVKPADGLSIAEDGTLKVSIDGTTLTMDQVNNVIKLADTLKEKIGSALQPESIANNQTTTKAGFALDARQANPNLDGTLAKQLSNAATKTEVRALNPADSIKICSHFSIGKLGKGWYRSAEIVCDTDTAAKGANSLFIEMLINQVWNVQVGCFQRVQIITKYSDEASISSIGLGTLNITKVRVVRKVNILYLDIFSRGYDDETKLLVNIPTPIYIASARAYDDMKVVPETADRETIVQSIELKDNFTGA